MWRYQLLCARPTSCPIIVRAFLFHERSKGTFVMTFERGKPRDHQSDQHQKDPVAHGRCPRLCGLYELSSDTLAVAGHVLFSNRTAALDHNKFGLRVLYTGVWRANT